MSRPIHRYVAFGMVLESAIALPELVIERTNSPADVIIEVVERFPSASVEGVRLLLDIPGVAQFCVEGGCRVFCSPSAGSCLDYIRLYLLGSVMGALLQQRGLVVLHGNAIALSDSDCRIVVGHSGAGKSTLAAWHYLRGAEMVSDDVCAISIDDNGRPWVAPGIPQLKIWRQSADLLRIPTSGLRRIRPGFEKYKVPLSSPHARQMRPLTEIYEIDQTRTEPLTLFGVDKIKRILAHRYRSSFVRQMGIESDYARKVMGLAPLIRMQSIPRRDLVANRE